MKRAILFPTLCSTGFALFAILIVIYIDRVYRLAARMCPNPWMENPISETQGCKGYIWKPYFFFFFFSYENQVILIWYTSLLSTSYHFMMWKLLLHCRNGNERSAKPPPPPPPPDPPPIRKRKKKTISELRNWYNQIHIKFSTSN